MSKNLQAKVLDSPYRLELGGEDLYTGDPMVSRYENALKLIEAAQWREAKAELEAVTASKDLPEVADRARQMLRAVERQLAAELEAEDPFLLAVYQKNRGQYAAALEICRGEGRLSNDERFAYLAASIFALEKRTDDAVAALLKAVELNPKNRVHAYHDPDFETLRDRPELEQLFDVS